MAPHPAATTSAAATGRVTFSFTVPAKPSAAARRRPQYISAQTAAITVTVTPAGGGSAVTAGPIPCTSVCTGSLAAPAGVDKVTFTALSSSNVALSTGTTVAVVAAGQANPISATLDGIVASMSLAVTPAAITPATPASGYLIVNAYDPAGSLITYNGAYVDASGAPVALDVAPSDPSVSLGGASTVTVSAPGAVIPWTYNGNLASGSAVTFTATIRSGSGFGTIAPVALPVGVTIVKRLAPMYPGLTVDATLPEATPGSGATAAMFAHTTAGVYDNLSESGLNSTATLGTSAAALAPITDSVTRAFNVALTTSGFPSVNGLVTDGSVEQSSDAGCPAGSTLVQALTGPHNVAPAGSVLLCRNTTNGAYQLVTASGQTAALNATGANLSQGARLLATTFCPPSLAHTTATNCLILLPVASGDPWIGVWGVDSKLTPFLPGNSQIPTGTFTVARARGSWVADPIGRFFANGPSVFTLDSTTPVVTLPPGSTISALCAQPSQASTTARVLYALVTQPLATSPVAERLVLDASYAPGPPAPGNGPWATGGFQTPALTSIPLSGSYAGFFDCNPGHVVLAENDGTLDYLGF